MAGRQVWVNQARWGLLLFALAACKSGDWSALPRPPTTPEGRIGPLPPPPAPPLQDRDRPIARGFFTRAPWWESGAVSTTLWWPFDGQAPDGLRLDAALTGGEWLSGPHPEGGVIQVGETWSVQLDWASRGLSTGASAAPAVRVFSLGRRVSFLVPPGKEGEIELRGDGDVARGSGLVEFSPSCGVDLVAGRLPGRPWAVTAVPACSVGDVQPLPWEVAACEDRRWPGPAGAGFVGCGADGTLLWSAAPSEAGGPPPGGWVQKHRGSTPRPAALVRAAEPTMALVSVGSWLTRWTPTGSSSRPLPRVRPRGLPAADGSVMALALPDRLEIGTLDGTRRSLIPAMPADFGQPVARSGGFTWALDGGVEDARLLGVTPEGRIGEVLPGPLDALGAWGSVVWVRRRGHLLVLRSEGGAVLGCPEEFVTGEVQAWGDWLLFAGPGVGGLGVLGLHVPSGACRVVEDGPTLDEPRGAFGNSWIHWEHPAGQEGRLVQRFDGPRIWEEDGPAALGSVGFGQDGGHGGRSTLLPPGAHVSWTVPVSGEGRIDTWRPAGAAGGGTVTITVDGEAVAGSPSLPEGPLEQEGGALGRWEVLLLPRGGRLHSVEVTVVATGLPLQLDALRVSEIRP